MNTLDTFIPAADGFQLKATLFEPETWQGSVVIINSATGVPRRFYKYYAQFLATAGHKVVTYDYRGTGDSRPASLKGFHARMRDWGEQDMTGMIDWISTELQPSRLLHVGHSVGGQVAGLLENHDKIDAMVTVSAQSGYWGMQPGMERYRTWWFVSILFPIVTPLNGYFPWKKLGSGEDLPANVALEWAKWCRQPNYFFDDRTLTSLSNFPGFRAPILAYSFTDDVWGSEKSVDFLMSHYTGAQVKRRHVTPSEAGMKSIGHMGFFRPKATALWQETLTWFEQVTQSPVHIAG